MKLFIAQILLASSIIACTNRDQHESELSDTIAQQVMDAFEKHLDTADKVILISAGHLSPSKGIMINGCNFDLVKEGSDTIYLATTDLKFRTSEGYKVGMHLSEFPDDIQKGLTKEGGWGYYRQIDSGWSIGFCEGSSCTDNYPGSNSEVEWIFRRK